MKKKVLFILFCFLILFVDSFHVEAATDYSLLYDVTDFEVTDNGIKISGFALRHNFDNINPTIKIFLVDQNDIPTFDLYVENKNISLYDWYCNRVTDVNSYYFNQCSSGYEYTNVGFKAELNFEKFYNNAKFDSNKIYTIKIQVCLDSSCSVIEDLGIMPGVAKGNSNNVEITSSTKTLKIYSSYSRLLTSNWGYSNLHNGRTYWTNGDSYEVKSVIKGGSSCKSGSTSYSYCPNLYELSYEPYSGNCASKLWDGSVNSGNGCSAYASAAWVKPNGSIKLKFKGEEDHVCSTSSGTLDGCSGSGLNKTCSQMTVYTNVNGKEISAIVSLKEEISLTPGDEGYTDDYNSYLGSDYSKYYVVRGRMFHYGLTYKNIASWDFVKKNYGDVSESSGDAAIRNEIISYYTPFADSISDKISIDKFGNDIGEWECSSNNNTLKANFRNTGKATMVCKFQLKHLYLDNDNASYGDELKIGNTVLTMGRNYYIPLNYDKTKFSWKVSGSDLSTLKVRNLEGKENSNITASLVSTSVDSSGNKCSIHVAGPNQNGDTGTNPNYPGPWEEYIEDALYVYRTVNISNPFPNGIPENWNNSKYLNRLKKSYDGNSEYMILLDSDKIDSITNANGYDAPYTDWSDTLISSSVPTGNNKFIDYFNTARGKHCLYGVFDDACDERVG